MFFNLNYINPTAIDIGPLSIKWYGIIIIVGILIGYFIAQESLKSIGLHKDTLVDIISYCAIFGFLVARTYFVIFQWPCYMENPSGIPKIWHGGIAVHGGLIGGFITGIILCKLRNLSPFQIGDIVAPSIILAQDIGRWGNFMNHEVHDGPVSRTSLENTYIPELIIRNMYIEGVYYHPIFLYESIWDILGFIILVTLRKYLRVGEIFSLYLIWYSVGHFFVEGLRIGGLMLTSHIRVAQLVSIILIIIGMTLIIYRRIKYQPAIYENAGPLTWNSRGKVK